MRYAMPVSDQYQQLVGRCCQALGPWIILLGHVATTANAVVFTPITAQGSRSASRTPGGKQQLRPRRDGPTSKIVELGASFDIKASVLTVPPAGLLWDHSQTHDSGPLPAKWSFGVGWGLVGHTVYSYPFYFEGSPACDTPTVSTLPVLATSLPFQKNL